MSGKGLKGSFEAIKARAGCTAWGGGLAELGKNLEVFSLDTATIVAYCLKQVSHLTCSRIDCIVLMPSSL